MKLTGSASQAEAIDRADHSVVTPDFRSREKPAEIKVAPAARRRKRQLPWGLLAVLLAVLAAGGYALRPQGPASVATLSLTAQPVERVLAVTGRIEARDRVSIQPKVAGQIITLTRDEGDQVTAGEVLALIDAAVPQADLAAFEAAIAAQQATLAQLRRDAERATELAQNGTGAASRAETLTAQVLAGEAELRRLQARQAESQGKLADYTIRAPFDGVLLSRPVDEGQVVDARTVLFEVADPTGQAIETEIDEQYLLEIRPGLTARAVPPGANAEPMEAVVTYVAPTVDPTTGGALVRLEMRDQRAAALPSGLSLDINLLVERSDRAIAIPRAAILEPQNRPRVLLVRDGVVAEQAVRFVDWPDSRVIVTEGLAEGDRLIVDPAGRTVGESVTATEAVAGQPAAAGGRPAGPRGPRAS